VLNFWLKITEKLFKNTVLTMPGITYINQIHVSIH
jgi:hypothetical protein